MGSMRLFVPVVFLLLAIVVAEGNEATMSCHIVDRNFMPCTYMISPGETVPDACCSGLMLLKELGTTPLERQVECACIQSTLATVRGTNPPPGYFDVIASYPVKCGVAFPFEISPLVYCNSVN